MNTYNFTIYFLNLNNDTLASKALEYRAANYKAACRGVVSYACTNKTMSELQIESVDHNKVIYNERF